MKNLVLLTSLLVLTTFWSCDQPVTLFKMVEAEASGLTFANRITENDTFNIIDFEFVYNGGGVGAGDFNGDGLTDLYFTGNTADNRLFLNLGNFKFKDVTGETGTAGRGRWCSGVSVSDINGDGRPDIYVSATVYEPGQRRANLLYLNEGNERQPDGSLLPRFREVAGTCGLADTSHTTQTAFFDYDRDGDLDAYVLIDEMDDRKIPNRYLPKRTDGSGRRNDKLLRNDGNDSEGLPHFTDVTREANILKDGYGLGISICDVNDDGWPDVYVTNDYLSNDLLWINNQDGTFTDRADDFFKHTAYSAMGNDVVDLNNDGRDEIIAVDMYPENNLRRKAMMPPNNYNATVNNARFGYLPQYTRNVLQLHRGQVPGTDRQLFADVGMQAGISATDWSWSPLAADFDNDGDRDLLITNGFPRDVTDRDFMDYNVVMSKLASREVRLAQIPSVKISNYAYENDGGIVPRFTKRTEEWGMDNPSFSNGAAFADLDNDGDLDYVVNNINDSCFLYRNTHTTSDSSSWLNFRLRGEDRNTEAIGATIKVYLTNGRVMSAFNHPVRGFLSSVADGLHFGFGPADKIDRIEVRWPTGEREAIDVPEMNRRLEVSKGTNFLPEAEPETVTPLLSSDPELLANLPEHRDSLFIDFNVQPLLPHKLSEFGPGLAVGDINGDGLDDLFRSGSHFFGGELLVRQADGSFQLTDGINEDINAEGLGSLFFDADGDGDQDLYIVSGGSEFAGDRPELLDQLLFNNGKGEFTRREDALPLVKSSGSCVRAADYDADGDLDLFVGGRLQPAAFPKPVDSYLLTNDGTGKFSLTDVPAFQQLGLVTDALWTDYDNDGSIDLLVAGQGMGLRLFSNQNGEITDATPAVFNDHVGWWNGLNGADFDGDGDIDYVAGNFGNNHLYRMSGKDYVGLYGADFDGNGGYDLLVGNLALAEDGNYREFPHAQRTDTEKQLISVKRMYERHDAFGRAEIKDLLAKFPRAQITALRSNFLSSVWIENLGDGNFTFHELPREVQLAPLFGAQPLDLNQDGYPDLVAIGNDYGAETGMGQMDGLNGLVLVFEPAEKNFRALDWQAHQFFVPGNGRSLVLLNGGEEPTVIASENSGPTRAFDPVWKGGAVRVAPRVQRVKYSLNGKPRVTEIYYGSGYLSQNSRTAWLPAGAENIEMINF